MMLAKAEFLREENRVLGDYKAGSQGKMYGLIHFCLYAKHLAPIRKIPCAYTQNFLACTQKQSPLNHNHSD